jgi:hypothetical protein
MVVIPDKIFNDSIFDKLFIHLKKIKKLTCNPSGVLLKFQNWVEKLSFFLLPGKNDHAGRGCG